MTEFDPSWSLTDDALALILHAENDIVEKVPTHRFSIGMRPGKLGGTVTDESWLHGRSKIMM